MAKPTIVKIISLGANDAKVKTSDGKIFYVTSLTTMNGCLDIIASVGNMTIYELGEIVSGCVEPDSTFENVNWITFTLSNVTVTVTRGEARNTEFVIQKWQKAWYDNQKAPK